MILKDHRYENVEHLCSVKQYFQNILHQNLIFFYLLCFQRLFRNFHRIKFSKSGLILAFIFSIVGYLVLLVFVGEGSVPVWKKVVISLYRTSTVHGFYLFTSSIAIFLFFEKLKELSETKKFLGCFIILFLFIHLAIFAYATPKWPTLGEFYYATFIQPGNSVNLSDTRGMMSVYPIFIFFIASLPFVRRRLINE